MSELPQGEVSEVPEARELPRLPRGRHGLSPEFVSRHQRSRLQAALADAVAANGYARTTVSDITSRAVVSKSTFYDRYDSKDDALLDAYDNAIGELRSRFTRAFDAERDWPRAIEAGLGALLEFLAGAPSVACLCLIEAPAAGRLLADRHDEALRGLLPYLEQGRKTCAPEVLRDLPPILEEGLAGGVVAVIAGRVAAGRAGELAELLPDLVKFVVTPYLGSTEPARAAGS